MLAAAAAAAATQLISKDLFRNIYPKWLISFIHAIGLTDKL